MSMGNRLKKGACYLDEVRRPGRFVALLQVGRQHLGHLRLGGGGAAGRAVKCPLDE